MEDPNKAYSQRRQINEQTAEKRLTAKSFNLYHLSINQSILFLTWYKQQTATSRTTEGRNS